MPHESEDSKTAPRKVTALWQLICRVRRSVVGGRSSAVLRTRCHDDAGNAPQSWDQARETAKGLTTEHDPAGGPLRNDQ
jgi:hypothetical protein